VPHFRRQLEAQSIRSHGKEELFEALFSMHTILNQNEECSLFFPEIIVLNVNVVCWAGTCLLLHNICKLIAVRLCLHRQRGANIINSLKSNPRRWLCHDTLQAGSRKLLSRDKHNTTFPQQGWN
jgi:hypothetical protein